MNTSIILLRGVMPSGKNKVPMARLREVLAKHGFAHVRTYIQSGNVLVNTGLGAGEIEKRVRELIKKHIGPELAVVARTRAELQKVLADNPFKTGHDITRVFFVLFNQLPAPGKATELLARDLGEEKLVMTKHAAYMYIPGPYGKGKLSNNYLEKQLGISATMRNFNTLSHLIEMSKPTGGENK
jgi:uncharacterized protein (DUF1697 family)